MQRLIVLSKLKGVESFTAKIVNFLSARSAALSAKADLAKAQARLDAQEQALTLAKKDAAEAWAKLPGRHTQNYADFFLTEDGILISCWAGHVEVTAEEN